MGVDEAREPRPRARLTAKGRATRARIVEAAADLMFERGVAGTSIDDVRRAAGVSGSQVTHYFDDKRSLIRAVVERQASVILDAHQRPPLGRLDSFEALRRWAEACVDIQRRRSCRGGCSLGSLAGELAEADADIRADLATGFERWEVLFRDGLRGMRERGVLRSEADPDELAHGLLAAFQGGVLLTQARRDVAPLRAALNTTLDHIESFAADDAVARAGRRPVAR